MVTVNDKFFTFDLSVFLWPRSATHHTRTQTIPCIDKKRLQTYSETFRIISQKYITRNIICSPHIANSCQFLWLLWQNCLEIGAQGTFIRIWACFQLWGWLTELVSSLLGSYRGQAFSGCSNLVSSLHPCKWDFLQGTLPNFIGSWQARKRDFLWRWLWSWQDDLTKNSANQITNKLKL